MVMCIPSYTLAAGLIDQGMSPWQAVTTVLLGNAIVLVPMLLIGHAGAKYGIPYAVLVRSSFGTRRRAPAGAAARDRRLRLVRHPDLVRRSGDLHAAQYPDRQCAGRRAICLCSASISAQLVCFLAFWALQLYFVAARHRFDPLARNVFRADQDRHVPGAGRWALNHAGGFGSDDARRRRSSSTAARRPASSGRCSGRR